MADWQVIHRPVISLPAIYDVTVVPHGMRIDVFFKTTKAVSNPAIEMIRGGLLERFEVGPGSGKLWAISVDSLDPATAYELRITVSTAPGKYVYYDHPTPVSTLERRVTITARYAYAWNDSDPGSCGDVVLGMQVLDLPGQGLNIAFGQENLCDGQTWNFPNKALVLDDVASDSLRLRSNATDDDTPWDNFEGATGEIAIDLLGEPESFVRTKTAAVDVPDPDSPGDLDFDVTFDFRVEYHS